MLLTFVNTSTNLYMKTKKLPKFVIAYLCKFQVINNGWITFLKSLAVCQTI